MGTATEVREAEAPDAMSAGCAWCAAALPAAARAAPFGRQRCRRCGVATTVPWPSDDELEVAYAGPYRPASGRFAGGGDALLRLTRTRLAARIGAIAPPGRVLDVGAGDGALVRALLAAGRDALGLEREPEPGSALRDGSLDDVEGPFAAVVLWHSLEHLRDAGAVLDRAATLLAPGGVLVVAVPNAASLQARVFGDRWFALDLPRHLVHIPAEALLERVAAGGLRIERVSYWRGGQVLFGWLHGLVGSIAGTGDMYDAIRRPQARQGGPLGRARRAWTLVAGGALLAPAALAAAGEVALRRGGTVYVEARRG